MARQDLETRDLAVVAGSILLPVVAAAVAYSQFVSSSAVHSVASTVSAFHALLFLVGAVYLALSWDRFDTPVTRSMKVVAAGFIGYVAVYYPHKVMWHGPGFGGKNAEWTGFSASTWQTFFHFAAVIALIIVTYGLFLFWQAEPGDQQ